MSNKEQVQIPGADARRKKRERFELMAVRVAAFLKLSNAATFDALPMPVKESFNKMQYNELVKPLMMNDKYKGMTCRQLGIKYGIPKSTVQRLLK